MYPNMLPDWKLKIYNDLESLNKYSLTLKTCFEQAKKSAQNDVQAIQNKLIADTNRYETIIKDLRSRLSETDGSIAEINYDFQVKPNSNVNSDLESLREEMSKLLKENRELQAKFEKTNSHPLARPTLADVPSRPSLNRLNHTEEINACVFSHEGSGLATASSDKKVHIYNSKLEPKIKITATGAMNYVAYSKDDENVICCSSDNIAYMYNFERDTNFFLEGHAASVLTADFTNDKRVVTGSKDKTIKYWDYGRQYCINSIHCTSFCTDLKVTNNNLICSGHFDGKIRVWDIRSQEQTLIIPTKLANNSIISVSLSPVDNNTILVVAKHSINTYDLTSTNVIREFSDPELKPKGSRGCFSPDGKCVAVGSGDGLIFVWDVDGAKLIDLKDSHQKNAITCVDWSKQGKLISCDKAGNTVLWNKPHV